MRGKTNLLDRPKRLLGSRRESHQHLPSAQSTKSFPTHTRSVNTQNEEQRD